MRRFGFGFTAIAIVATAACGGTDDSSAAAVADDGIRVASFDFAESELLAELYAQVIESTGTPVVRLGAVGPREVLAPALELGRLDVVPEYLGTALRFAGAAEPNADAASALDELNEFLEERGLVALDAAPAEDKNVFAVTADMAERFDLESISDLAPIASDLRFGGPPECADRPLCLAGLRTVYGLEFESFVPQRSLTFTAEALRREEIGVGLMFSTASELAAFDFVVLDDDRLMQPAENVVPVVRVDALERWGAGVAEALNAMSLQLTTRELRILNVQVGNGEPVESVAREWLMTKHLLR